MTTDRGLVSPESPQNPLEAYRRNMQAAYASFGIDARALLAIRKKGRQIALVYDNPYAVAGQIKFPYHLDEFLHKVLKRNLGIDLPVRRIHMNTEGFGVEIGPASYRPHFPEPSYDSVGLDLADGSYRTIQHDDMPSNKFAIPQTVKVDCINLPQIVLSRPPVSVDISKKLL